MNVLSRLVYRLRKLSWRVTRPTTLGARVILEKDGAILLVKHTYHRHWYLPGGGVNKGETVEEAARREAAEEVGAELGELRLVGVYDSFSEYKSDHVVVFSCDSFTLGGGTDAAEIEHVQKFSLRDLPVTISPATLRRIREYVSGEGLPVVGPW